MKHWIQAARLRTLPLSMSGIILGAFIAKWKLNIEGKYWDLNIFIFAILTTLCYQILSNFANDYGDAVKGTDQNRNSKAEKRAIASGKISPEKMKKGIYLMSGISLICTLILLYITFFPNYIFDFYIFIGLGILSILAAIGYTMGKKPYGYLGLGDIMVFLFFGILSVSGSYFLFTKEWHWEILLPASAIGLLSTAVLNLNNMRDIETDRLTHKKTFALKIGYKKAMIYQMILMHLPLILILIYLLLEKLHEKGKYYAFIFMVLMLPLSALRRRIFETKNPENLDPFLRQVGIFTFVLSILVALGLNFF